MSMQPAPTEPSGPDQLITPPSQRVRKHWLGLAGLAIGVAIVVGGVGWFAATYVRNTGSHASPRTVLQGVPLQIDKSAMQAQAEQDTRPLLSRNYSSFYTGFGLTQHSDADNTLHNFQVAVDKLEATGNCTLGDTTVEATQGSGLDSNPNSVTVAGLVTCGSTTYTLSMLYYGNGNQPERFAPAMLTLTSTASNLVADLMRIPGVYYTITGSDAQTPPHSLVLPLTAPSEAPTVAAGNKLGNHCLVLLQTPTTTIRLRNLHGAPDLKIAVAYAATCDGIRSPQP